MKRQNQTGGFLPEKDVAIAPAVDVVDVLKQQKEEEEELNEKYALPALIKHKSIRPLSLGNWMFDVVADLTSTKPAVAPPPPPLPISTTTPGPKTGRRLTIQIPSSPVYDGSNRRHQSCNSRLRRLSSVFITSKSRLGMRRMMMIMLGRKRKLSSGAVLGLLREGRESMVVDLEVKQ